MKVENACNYRTSTLHCTTHICTSQKNGNQRSCGRIAHPCELLASPLHELHSTSHSALSVSAQRHRPTASLLVAQLSVVHAAAAPGPAISTAPTIWRCTGVPACRCGVGGAAATATGAGALAGATSGDNGVFLRRRPRRSHQKAITATTAMMAIPTRVMIAMSFKNGGGIDGGCGGGNGAGGGGGNGAGGGGGSSELQFAQDMLFPVGHVWLACKQPVHEYTTVSEALQ